MKTRPPLIRLASLTALFTGSLAAAALLLCGNVAQAQPTITGTYPNGTNLFQPAAQLTFTASSPATITNVTVTLKTTAISTGTSFFKTLTPGNGLTVSGPNTGETVTTPLQSNKVYSATIQITDGNGVSASSTVNFDTVTPSYTFEAEDWDYTGGTTGQFFDNPQVNAYATLPSTQGVDVFMANLGSGGSAYRPQGLATETASDVPRLAYIGTTNIDYDIGFGTSNTWANYTRHYPAGTYNLYMRGADGNSTDVDSARVSVQSGTGSIAGTAPFTFSVPSAGWQTYFFVPAKGADGKLAQITFDNTASTLQILEDGGDMNANFYMLVPADTNVPVIATTITNIYPDGTVQFQATNNFVFTANSSNGIDPSGITLIVNGTNLLGHGYTSNLTSANGLTIGGTSTSRSVSTPIASNTMYTVFIQVIDGSGNPVSTSVTFDTISPSYTFEAEDWDFGGGSFVDNPQTNAYAGVTAIDGTDSLVSTNNRHSFIYRGGALSGFGLNTEPNGDAPRTSYIGTGFIDYDVGWNSGGDWGNYTRHYPAGTYNVYLRGANGGVNGPNNSGAGQANVSLLTSGFGTANQTVSNMGTFTILSTGNWQKYVWWPLLDPSGNLVKFTGGSQQTLRVTTLGGASGGSYNANFYMLVPADTTLPVISGLYPDGTSLFQNTNKLKFVASSAAGIATNSIVVKLDGVNATGLAFTGTSNSWNVTCPVSVNASHTVAITITDANGNSASSTVSFDTFQPSDYQWEAEDYDYTSNGVSGLFFDTGVDQYFDLPSTAGIDNVQSDQNANPLNYRNVDTNGFLGLSPSTDFPGDLARAKFTGTNVDYYIGFFGPGSWVNYTRHYAPGTYTVWQRYAEGGSLTESTLSKVTSGYGTATQTTSLLGTFTNVVAGWSLWSWAPLVDTNGNTVKITLDGSRTTLQLGGSPVANHSEVNVNFLLLAPAASGVPVRITATISGGNIQLSFPTAVGSSYQVQYKNALTDATWTNLGGPLTGNGSTMSASDPISGSSRFYKLQIQ